MKVIIGAGEINFFFLFHAATTPPTGVSEYYSKVYRRRRIFQTSSSRQIKRKFWLAGVKLSRRGKLVALEGSQISETVKCNICTTEMQNGTEIC